jgi:hypothetical protein
VALSKQLGFLICMHIHCSATNITTLILLCIQMYNLSVLNSVHEDILHSYLSFVATKSKSSAVCILILVLGKVKGKLVPVLN